MNTEEDEFKRIEVEAKRRAAKDKDDDTQVYTSEVAASYSYRCGYEAGAAAAIKEALAQPEQEPVAWADMDVRGEDKGLSWTPGHFHKTPLYATPPQRTWVGLTQTQVKLLWEGVPEEAIKSGDSVNWIFYTHINEALKERNT